MDTKELKQDKEVAIEPIKLEPLSTEHIKVTPYAITFEGSPSLDEWYDVFGKVNTVNTMTQFYLGDLVAYAESPDYGWGDTYTKLMDESGYAYETLSKFARVSRRFSPQVREEIFAHVRENTSLSYRHFEEVMPLDDAHAFYFLEMVRDGGWSIRKIQEEKARLREQGNPIEVDENGDEIIEIFPEDYMSLDDYTGEVRGYIPAPYNNDQPSCLVELTEGEMVRLLRDYEDDTTMTIFFDKIRRAYGTGKAY